MYRYNIREIETAQQMHHKEISVQRLKSALERVNIKMSVHKSILKILPKDAHQNILKKVTR